LLYVHLRASIFIQVKKKQG